MSATEIELFTYNIIICKFVLLIKSQVISKTLCVSVYIILQLTSANLDSKLREDLERMKKIRAHRGLRHYWGLRVRGQHTKTTGRRGRTVGVSKKK